MFNKKSILFQAQEVTKEAVADTNKKIEELGEKGNELFPTVASLQVLFEMISGTPDETKIEYARIKEERLNWEKQAEVIENEYYKALGKNTGKGIAGVGTGIGVATMGPSAAMGVATTFGVASTGTAISSLSGAAATNAALAWLGGGTIAAGGGGMSAGGALLTLAGPIGWAIGGISLLASGVVIFVKRKDKKIIDEVFRLISLRDTNKYRLAITELNERIEDIDKEIVLLNDAIEEIKTFGTDYDKMTEKQQYTLGSYVNLMNSSTQLLINPIKGLEPQYLESDYEVFRKFMEQQGRVINEKYKNTIIWLASLLYKIKIDEKGRKLLWKSLKKNKKLLKELNISKKEYKEAKGLMDIVNEALEYKYSNE